MLLATHLPRESARCEKQEVEATPHLSMEVEATPHLSMEVALPWPLRLPCPLRMGQVHLLLYALLPQLVEHKVVDQIANSVECFRVLGRDVQRQDLRPVVHEGRVTARRDDRRKLIEALQCRLEVFALDVDDCQQRQAGTLAMSCSILR